MNKILFAFLVFTLPLAAYAQVVPSAKVTSARSKSSLSLLSEEQILEMNFRAEHLVAVDASKSSSLVDFSFVSVGSGETSELSDSEILNLNPLLYAIPQDEVVCKNLHVQSTEGNSFTLVVLSKQQYDQQFKQYLRDLKKKK